MQFEIVKTPGRTPNGAKVLIFNLSQETEGRMLGEGAEVIVTVGYADTVETVFRGQLRHRFSYRQDSDRILQLDAADGDKDFRDAFVNKTFSAGTTTAQIVDHLIALCPGTIKGTVLVANKTLPRARTMCGMVRDFLESIARDNNAHWSIQDGAHNIVPANTTLPIEAIKISAETGMLNAPELTDKGVKVECLLNPALRVGGKVHLDNNTLKGKIALKRASLVPKKPPKNAPKAQAKKKPKELARLDPDGLWKVLQVTHKGDNRGMPWVSIVEAVALEKTIPSGRQAA